MSCQQGNVLVLVEGAMNCPSCSAPMLFGSTSCTCGYGSAGAEPADSDLEVSYWEAFRAYWRGYWPTQVVSFVVIFFIGQVLLAYVTHRREIEPLSSPLPIPLPFVVMVCGLIVSALALFLFVSRLVSRPYSGFSLVVVAAPGGEDGHHLRVGQRGQVWFFLWWRQLAAGLLAVLLAAPLNVLLALMGLNISTQVGAAGGVFIIGPVLVKMLVGNAFPGFSIEARRG
jgi:hypothetical protein